MNVKKYVGDNFLSSTFKIKYSTIKVENLQTNHKIFYDYLISNTKYLKTDNISERLYHIYNELTENVLCSYCLKNIPKFQTFKTGYRECCSNKCSTKGTSDWKNCPSLMSTTSAARICSMIVGPIVLIFSKLDNWIHGIMILSCVDSIVVS